MYESLSVLIIACSIIRDISLILHSETGRHRLRVRSYFSVDIIWSLEIRSALDRLKVVSDWIAVVLQQRLAGKKTGFRERMGCSTPSANNLAQGLVQKNSASPECPVLSKSAGFWYREMPSCSLQTHCATISSVAFLLGARNFAVALSRLSVLKWFVSLCMLGYTSLKCRVQCYKTLLLLQTCINCSCFFFSYRVFS